MDPGPKLQGLNALTAEVVNSSDNYEALVSTRVLHQFPRTKIVNGVSIKVPMREVYDDKFAKVGQPGRPIYNMIIGAPRNKLCPLCGINFFKTLDHHLPKAEYPLLAVTAANFVPSCYFCQNEKKKQFPKAEREQTLHPYFDNYNDEIWLRATVVEGVEPLFTYSVDAPEAWEGIVSERLHHHLGAFNLYEYFTQRATGEWGDVKGYLGNLFLSGGAEEVKKYLSDQVTSFEAVSLNSWRVAMYRAAAESHWFCVGGFDPNPA